MSTHHKSITEVFQDEVYQDCDHCQSIFSPAAYLVKLLEIIDKYIEPKGALRKRRPDLYALKLNCDNTLKEKLYLEVVNEILEKRIDEGKEEHQKLGEWLKVFATDYWTSGLPFFLRQNFPLFSIRTYLKENKITLKQLYHLFYPGVDTTAETLEFSPESYDLLLTLNNTESDLKSIYGFKQTISLKELMEALERRENFIKRTGIQEDRLPEVLEVYNRIMGLSEKDKLSIESVTETLNKVKNTYYIIKNLNTDALYVLHRIIVLSNHLGCSFEAMSYIIMALGIDLKDIDRDKLKDNLVKIASMKELGAQFDKELTGGYKDYILEDALHPSLPLLYLSEGLFKEKVKKFVGGQGNYDKLAQVDIHEIKSSDQMGVLQSLLALSNDDLSALINYQVQFFPKDTAVESLLQDLYAQSTLNQLMGISMSELLGLMNLLDNEKAILSLSLPENLHQVMALHKELKGYSMNPEDLTKLLSSDDEIKARYADQIKALLEAIGEISPWDESEFSQVLSGYFTLNQDTLSAIVHFSQKRTGKSFENSQERAELLIELIKDIEVFSALEFIGEDIDHLNKHYEKVYKLEEGKWNWQALEKLLYYRELKGLFSSNTPNLIQYIDWLYSQEATQEGITEKMSALSRWDKEILELLKDDKDFKEYFSKEKNPIEALKKIQSFMDLLFSSGLNTKILLELKGLQGLLADNDWQKYVDAVSHLKLLGEASDKREESEKTLQEQKRDLLSNYMLCNSEVLENLRHLYAELLMDVEMSGCSKISPLKAALNSVQLYVHRCTMRLEEGTEIDPSLSNQTLDLLGSYRKWEASQKIQSHPENYLDPTLRKIASPQFGELQNTLMQGNITEEAVGDAYLGYFEEFDQLASLEIIDSYFDKVKDPISKEEKHTMFLLGRSITRPYTYHYCTAVFDSKNPEPQKDQEILYWTPWEKIEATIPADTVTSIYAFGRFFVFWVEKMEKMEADTGGSVKGSMSASIRYVFQRVSGKWSEMQTLADDLDIPQDQDDEHQTDKLCWRKVAALQLKDQKQEEPEEVRYMIVAIGDVKGANAEWFLIDEDLIAKKQSSANSKLSLENFSDQSDPGPLLSYHSLNKKISSGAQTVNINDKTIFFQSNGNADIYDTVTKGWTSTQGFEARQDPSVAVVGQKAIFFGGHQGANPFKAIDIYNNQTDQWTTAEASYQRWNASAAVVGNKAIFLGGRLTQKDDDEEKAYEIDIYNNQTDQWTTAKADRERDLACAATIGQNAIFFGGWEEGGNGVENVDIYNNTTNKWTSAKVGTDNERGSVTAAVVGNKAIFFGGETKGDKVVAAINIYENGKFTESSYTMSEGRWHASAAVVGNKAIFFGGQKPGYKRSSAIDIYDSGQWRKESYQASEARSLATVAVVGQRVIFFGGKTGENTYSSAVDIYDDKSGKWTDLKVKSPLKNPAVKIQGTKAIFIGLDESNNAQMYTIDFCNMDSLSYRSGGDKKLLAITTEDDKKLSATTIEHSLLYVNSFPEATESIVSKDPYFPLLKNYTEDSSNLYPVRNHLGGYMVRNGLEVFLSLPKDYTRYPIISDRSFYDLSPCSVMLRYSPPDEVKPDLKDLTFRFLRLNIPKGVSALRQKAYADGVEGLLTLEAQTLKIPDFSLLEPTSKVIPPEDLSHFEGPYGLYLWETFFHIPTLIWRHLNADQAFSDAKTWQEYIINPEAEGGDIWQFLPFSELYNHEKLLSYLNDPQSERDLEIDPFDAYSIAAQNITSFEKYVVISYIDNLLSWGDMLFGEGSWESLNEATMLYVRAWDLLGVKPIKSGKVSVEDKSYDDLQGAYEKNLKLLDLEKLLKSDHPKVVPLRIAAATEAMSMAAYEDYFCTPENEGFVSLWDKLQDRLYKIRHCLDITGQPHMPALFEPVLDPKALMQASAAGGSGIGIPEISKIPFYRFDYMISYAKSTVEMVIGLGAELLSVMEKKDAEALSALYNKQESILAALITPIKEKTIEALKEERKALSEGLNNANYRKNHYDQLISQNLSPAEIAAISFSSAAIVSRNAGVGIRGVAAGLHYMPSIFGLAFGGSNPGAASDSSADIPDILANISEYSAQMASTSASYQRRAEEWTLQRDLADYDAKQIQAQIEANLIYQANAQKELQSHQKSIEQMKEKKDFFEKKFTREELYGWMKAQIASVYFQGYKLALKIAKQAEKTYQYELNTEEVFITSNGWNSLKEGLLAGHHLKFALEQMHATYHDQDERDLEISKSISLKEIDPYALYQLKEEGQCQFAFTEKLFDLDFPGHYNRKIKALRISIPAVVGPYESIHASVQQTSNKTVLKAEGKGIDAVKFLLGEKGAADPNDPNVLRSNVNMNQLIALSRGNADSGMFELNFNDTRYLPFEGTGAVSHWTLKLRKKNNRFDIQSISDVIVHLDYTASDGEDAFRESVEKLETLKTYQGVLAVNLISTYPEEWEKFKEEKEAFVFQPSIELFPSYLDGIKVNASDKLYGIPITSEEPTSVKIDELNSIAFQSDYSLNIGNSSDFVLGKDWTMKISGDLNKLEEILLLFPFTAERL